MTVPRKANPPPDVLGTEADFQALTADDQKLAELLVTGETRSDAWRRSSDKRAGHTYMSAAVAVNRKLKDAKFCRAFSYLRAQLTERTIMDAVAWLRGVVEIAAFDPAKLQEIGEGTVEIKDLTRAERAAIHTFTASYFKDGTVKSRTVKATSRLDAYKAMQAALDIATHKIDTADAVGQLAELLAGEGAANPEELARQLTDSADAVQGAGKET